jgi:hypothetical protein
MYIYDIWLYMIYCMWKVPKWPWFWAQVAVKAWQDLATLEIITVVCATVIPVVLLIRFALFCFKPLWPK